MPGSCHSAYRQARDTELRAPSGRRSAKVVARARADFAGTAGTASVTDGLTCGAATRRTHQDARRCLRLWLLGSGVGAVTLYTWGRPATPRGSDRNRIANTRACEPRRGQRHPGSDGSRHTTSGPHRRRRGAEFTATDHVYCLIVRTHMGWRASDAKLGPLPDHRMKPGQSRTEDSPKKARRRVVGSGAVIRSARTPAVRATVQVAEKTGGKGGTRTRLPKS